MDVRFLDEDASFELTLFVNGVRQGAAWRSSGTGGGWTTHTVSRVDINEGDTIAVKVEAEVGVPGRLDYVQLNLITANEKVLDQLDDWLTLPGGDRGRDQRASRSLQRMPPTSN